MKSKYAQPVDTAIGTPVVIEQTTALTIGAGTKGDTVLLGLVILKNGTAVTVDLTGACKTRTAMQRPCSSQAARRPIPCSISRSDC